MAIAAAGYSGTPLAQKLGLKDGQRVLFIGLPAALSGLATARQFVEATRITLDQLGDSVRGYDVIHLFTSARAALEAIVRPLLDLVARNGMIWVS